jgi:hypothetical protein
MAIGKKWPPERLAKTFWRLGVFSLPSSFPVPIGLAEAENVSANSAFQTATPKFRLKSWQGFSPKNSTQG